MSEPTYRDVAGLRVPAHLVPPLITAFREEYPTVTDGIDDDEAAVRAVLKHLTTQILITHRTRMVAAAGEQQVAAVREEVERAVDQAQQQALAAADLISETPQ